MGGRGVWEMFWCFSRGGVCGWFWSWVAWCLVCIGNRLVCIAILFVCIAIILVAGVECLFYDGGCMSYYFCWKIDSLDL